MHQSLIWAHSTSYLTGRKQRVKFNSSFSSCLNLFQGVSQESIVETLLSNQFFCNLLLLFEEADIMNYADDNTPYVFSGNIDATLVKL